MIEQTKFTSYPSRQAFEKQTIEEVGRKQIHAITNQNKILETLTNKDDDKDNYKETFQEKVTRWT